MPSARSLWVAALALLVGGPLRAADPAITPRPLRVVEQPGAVSFDNVIPLVAEDAGARSAARYLADLARRSGGSRLAISTSARGRSIRFVRRAGFAPEGYALDIDDAGATIAASTDAGLLYGAVSLWQLFSAAPPHHRLQRMHIDDAPRFAWRGVLIDSARHFQSPAEIVRTLDWMALHKLNRLQWHLADDQGWRLEIRHYPRLTSIAAWRSTPPAAGLVPGRYGGFYTQAEVRRIVAMAAARNITIVPEIEMPGHATAAILAYPEIGFTTMTRANLGDWGVFPSIYGTGPATFTFLHNVLDEVMALFPSREIAIGGDEAVHTAWRDSPAVQAQMRALGLKDEDALQGWFVGRIGDYLAARGRRLVGWDEIQSDPTLRKSDIVLSWHGADGAIAAARAGHDVVMATAPTLYLDNRQSAAATEPSGRGFVVSLHDVYAYDPGDPPHTGGAALDADAAQHILGVQGALWSEHIPSDRQLEAMALPRVAALAETGWTAEGRRDWPGFVARLPAMIARYRALGFVADDGAVVPQPAVTTDGVHAAVTLARQLDQGQLRYTTDGSAPTPASPLYARPLDLPFPARLRAASFSGAERLSRDIDLPLDAISATHRASQQLDLCTDAVSLNLAGRSGPYLVDIKNPCWIYRGARAAHGGHIAVSVAALPFNFQLANETAPLTWPHSVTPAGEWIVRNGCTGPVLATVTLAGVPRDGNPHELIAALPPIAAPTDLCLTLARPSLSPIWVLGWAELRP